MNSIQIILATLIILCFLNPQTTAASFIQGVYIENTPELIVLHRSQGGILLLSDSPEMVVDDGILYQDKVEGDVRLFFYHVNAADTGKKFDVLLQNTTHEVAHVTVTKSAIGGPGYVWMAVGKEAMTSYLAENKPYQIAIPPGEVVPLAAKISENAILPNTLINGIFDFTADQPVMVTVAMMPLFENSVQYIKSAKVLSKDQSRMRGTFDGANRQLIPLRAYNPDRDKAVTITLADNDIDPYLRGIDATDGSDVINYGNYGVVYQISLLSQGKGQIGYYLMPLGGLYAGAIGINHPDVHWSPLALPLEKLSFGSKNSGDYAFLGTYDCGDPLSFTFSPPGGSNLPVLLAILPQ